eukprot:TRINITY_DN1940_c0_g1_i3.p1 TRINITY_DN1940_c0_g1~~TRINITY_DN1940_c0_g1_i3.p1  ORF type:complete len:224 (+),score=51.05 TRINITY_DN1940_c0_g1_i3:82-672(+)
MQRDDVPTMPDALRRTKQLNIASLTPAAISAYFDNVYTTYEWLMSSLSSDEVYYEFPNRLRRPLIFYLGHTAVFYINKLCSAGVLTEEQRPNPHYEDIFAVGVDEMSWDDMADDHFEWPPVADVWKYRRAVKALVLEAIPALDWSAPVTRDMHKQWSVLMSTYPLIGFAIRDISAVVLWRYFCRVFSSIEEQSEAM